MATTALEALTRRRFLISGWPWCSATYLLTTPPTALAAVLPLTTLALPWAVLVGKLSATASLAKLGLLLAAGPLLLWLLGPIVTLPLGAIEHQ